MTDKEDIQRIKDKIAKLLNLSESQVNEHEATNAARKARILMDKHQLSIFDIERGESSESLVASVASDYSSRWPLWKTSIAIAIAELNDCICDFHCKIELNSRRFSRAIRFKGFESDVELSGSLFYFILDVIEEHAERYRETGAFAKMVNHYREAMAQRIRERLDEIRESRESVYIESKGTSLIVVKSQMVESEFGKKKYKTVNIEGRIQEAASDRLLAEARIKGRRDAESVEINKKLQ